jgi:hypothetical protein
LGRDAAHQRHGVQVRCDDKFLARGEAETDMYGNLGEPVEAGGVFVIW